MNNNDYSPASPQKQLRTMGNNAYNEGDTILTC